jgi:hypothetical protein
MLPALALIMEALLPLLAAERYRLLMDGLRVQLRYLSVTFLRAFIHFQQEMEADVCAQTLLLLPNQTRSAFQAI